MFKIYRGPGLYNGYAAGFSSEAIHERKPDVIDLPVCFAPRGTPVNLLPEARSFRSGERGPQLLAKNEQASAGPFV